MNVGNNNYMFTKMKDFLNLIKSKALVIVVLISTHNISFSQKIDKKCNQIYLNFREKDSLLRLSNELNNSLSNENKELKLTLNKLQAQLDVINHEAKLIKIGNQKWDNDNLKVTELNDGSPIFFADTREKWDSLFRINEPAYCIHKNDSLGTYGYLYNYHAIETGKLAPIGMRVPVKSDIEELIKFLDSETLKSAMLLKSKDSDDLRLPKWKFLGLDKYGMNIKPCGFRLDDSKEWYFANKVYYWTQSKELKKIEMLVITEINDDPFILEKTIEEKNSNYGLYVRCIK
jgi:uncharacterized protein (TIGR02145 family)